jgi:hypothetical protein
MPLMLRFQVINSCIRHTATDQPRNRSIIQPQSTNILTPITDHTAVIIDDNTIGFHGTPTPVTNENARDYVVSPTNQAGLAFISKKRRYTCTAPFKQFRFFPKLPAELRQKILKLSIVPRTVEVMFSRSHVICKPYNTPVPAILHVNKESRQFGLQIYKPRFQTPFLGTYIYVDLEIDIILMDSSDLRRLQKLAKGGIKEDLEAVRFLESDFWYRDEGCTYFRTRDVAKWLAPIAFFPGLKKWSWMPEKKIPAMKSLPKSKQPMALVTMNFPRQPTSDFQKKLVTSMKSYLETAKWDHVGVIAPGLEIVFAEE